jgi:hypothetical protein
MERGGRDAEWLEPTTAWRAGSLFEIAESREALGLSFWHRRSHSAVNRHLLSHGHIICVMCEELRTVFQRDNGQVQLGYGHFHLCNPRAFFETCWSVRIGIHW